VNETILSSRSLFAATDMTLPDYIRPLTPGFAVAPQLGPAQMAEVAAAGYKSVIINRPDFEGGPDQPEAAAVAAAARAAGLAVEYQPVAGGNITAADVTRFAGLLRALPGPVLAYCRTGTRCTNLFELAKRQGE
jgi:uncharacterized protein (TIGR01244 family)